MAINKAVAAGVITPGQLKQVKDFELIIDAQLQQKYTGKGSMIVTPVPWPTSEKVRQELVRRYEKEGWEVTVHADSTEPWFTFA